MRGGLLDIAGSRPRLVQLPIVLADEADTTRLINVMVDCALLRR